MARRPLRVNFIVNLLSPTVRIAVALVTIPLYLHHMGDARYGVMSIVWVLLGLFGFLDLGLSRAVTNSLAKLRDAPQPERARVLLTTFSLNLGIGLIGGVVLYRIRRTFAQIFHYDPRRTELGGGPGAPVDRLSSAADAYFRRRRRRSGEPRALPAREFDPDRRNDFYSSRSSPCGCFCQPLAYGRYSDGRRRTGVGRDRPSGCRLSFGRALLASGHRLGRKRGSCSAMAAGCSPPM